MKICLAQMNMKFCSPNENFEKAKKMIDCAARQKCDTVVLPEMWNTGFLPTENLESLCDNNCERLNAEIGSLAKKYGINIIAGSIADFRNSKAYNTACVFGRDGTVICKYDKINLFYPMEENIYFTKGETPCIFTIDGVKCGIIICFDIRFPELVKEVSENSDILFVVAQWPDVRIDQLEALAKQRASENGSFVAVCNSCGEANGTQFGGKSFLCDKNGHIISSASQNEELIFVEI